MIRFSAIVSVVALALVLLIAGAVSGTLALVYMAIAVASLALVLLIAGVVIWRDEVFGSPAAQAAADRAPAGREQVPGPAAERVPATVAAGPVPAGPAPGRAPEFDRPHGRRDARDAETGRRRPPAGQPARAPRGSDVWRREERQPQRADRPDQGPARAEPPAPGERPAAAGRPDDDAARRRVAAAAAAAATIASPPADGTPARPDVTRPIGTQAPRPAASAPGRSATGTPPEEVPERTRTTRENTRVAPVVPAAPAAKVAPATDTPAVNTPPPARTAQPSSTARPGESAAKPAAATTATETDARAPAAPASAKPAAPASDKPASAATPAASTKVTVVPGIARYHKADCILIRFLGAEDLETMPIGQAEESGCVPCRACRPEKELATA